MATRLRVEAVQRVDAKPLPAFVAKATSAKAGSAAGGFFQQLLEG